MKSLIFSLLVLIVGLSGCSKSKTSGGVIYEVTVSQGTWDGYYTMHTSSGMTFIDVYNQPSDKKINNAKPKIASGSSTMLLISANASGDFGQGTIVTAKIYVDGDLVATDTNNDIATAQYILQN